VAGVVLLAVVVVGLAASIVGTRDHSEAWTCRAADVAPGIATASTPDEAVRRFVATGAAPADGWSPSEPNRWSRQVGGVQMVIDVDQADVATFTVVRLSTCGPGI